MINLLIWRTNTSTSNPHNPAKCLSIWSYDTSISSSDHVVSDDIKIIAVSFVVFKWRGGGTKCPPPSSYVSQTPIQDRVKSATFLQYTLSLASRSHLTTFFEEPQGSKHQNIFWYWYFFHHILMNRKYKNQETQKS